MAAIPQAVPVGGGAAAVVTIMPPALDYGVPSTRVNGVSSRRCRPSPQGATRKVIYCDCFAVESSDVWWCTIGGCSDSRVKVFDNKFPNFFTHLKNNHPSS